MARIGDLLLGIWFLLVALAFWGPYLGIPFPSNMGTALYALMLLAAIAGLALRVVGGRNTQNTADVARTANTGDG
jgi:apolipoprotein N-acyltransferase